MRYQYQRMATQQSSVSKRQPRFAPPPVIQPKTSKKIQKELPEWKPGGDGRSNILARLLEAGQIQAKLAIGEPNDKYEQEADRVARDVVSQMGGKAAANSLSQKKSNGMQGLGCVENRAESMVLGGVDMGRKNTSSHNTIQRKVVVNGEDIQPVVKQIEKEKAYIFCEDSKEVVSIEKGIVSETIPKTPHNQNKMDKDVDVKITLKEEHIQNGLEVDKATTINADGRTHEDVSVVEDTGMLPLFDITGRYETIKKSLGMERRAIVPNDLSGATVLLHEMGHAVQYLKTLPTMKQTQGQYKGQQLIAVPVLSNIKQLDSDIEQGQVDSLYWPLRVYELSDMGMVLNILQDLKKEQLREVKHLNLEDIKNIESLRLMVLDRVKIWLEHDVMINVEHPFAKKQNEGIRLRHGEELDQRTPRVQEGQDSRLELTRVEKEDRTVVGKDQLNVDTAKKEMVLRLQKDSQGLPSMMKELVEMYQSVKLPEDFLEEYVGDEFK